MIRPSRQNNTLKDFSPAESAPAPLDAGHYFFGCVLEGSAELVAAAGTHIMQARVVDGELALPLMYPRKLRHKPQVEAQEIVDAVEKRVYNEPDFPFTTDRPFPTTTINLRRHEGYNNTYASIEVPYSFSRDIKTGLKLTKSALAARGIHSAKGRAPIASKHIRIAIFTPYTGAQPESVVEELQKFNMGNFTLSAAKKLFLPA